MTLQNSISADKGNNMKFFFKTVKNAWTQSVAYFVIFFLFGPVLMLIGSNSYKETVYRQKNIEGFVEFLGCSYSLFYFICAVIAVFCAIFMFNYLNSRTNVNFYHSLPFRRTRLFFINYFAGILVFTVSYGINYLICISVPAFIGMGFSQCLPVITSVFLNSLLYFLLFYSMTVMIGMLTGFAPVQWLMTVAAVSVIPAVKFGSIVLCSLYSSEFWIDYYLSPDKFILTSPAVSAFINSPFTGRQKAVFVLLCAVFTIAAIVIYHHRLSERSGDSFVFNGFASAVKYVIMFPSSIGFALIFCAIGDNSVFWLVFGGIVGSLLSWMIMNSIINKTARAMFRGVRGFLIFTLAALAYILTLALGSEYAFDKLISADSAKSITIEIDGYDEFSRYEFKDRENKEALISVLEKSRHPYVDFDAESTSDSEKLYYHDYKYITIGENEYYTGYTRGYKRIRMVVKSRLGIEYAFYTDIDTNYTDIREEMKTVCESEEYRNQILNKLTNLDGSSIYVSLQPNMIKDGRLMTTKGKPDLIINNYEDMPYDSKYYDFGFIEAYKKDLENISFDMYMSPAIGEITVGCIDRYGQYSSETFPITMKFTNTIEYFAECGIMNSADYAQDFAEVIGDIYVYDPDSDKIMTVSDTDKKASIISACGTGISGSGSDSFFMSYDGKYRVLYEDTVYEYLYEYDKPAATDAYEGGTMNYEGGTMNSDGKTYETVTGYSSLQFARGAVPEFVADYFSE